MSTKKCKKLRTSTKITKMVMEDFYNQYAKKIFCEERLQRRVVWAVTNKVSFINSCLSYADVPLNPIWLADIESCIQYCEENYNQKDSAYFRELFIKGYKWLSLDGQNRTDTIKELFDNKLPVYSEDRLSDLYDINGNGVHISPNRSKTMEQLPEPLRYALERKEIQIGIVDNTDFNTLGKHFRRLNDGVPLNNMEKRNSLPTLIGDFIVKIAKKYRGTFAHLNETQESRMLDLQFIGENYIATHQKFKYEWDSKDNGLDRLYKLASNVTKEDPYPGEGLARYENICKMVDMATRCSANLNLKTMRLLFASAAYLHDKGYEFIDSETGSNFTKWVINSQTFLHKQVEIIRGQEQLRSQHTGEAPPAPSNYFKHWVGNFQVADSRKSALRAWIHGESIQKGQKLPTPHKKYTVKYALENGLLDEFIQQRFSD